MFNNLFIFVLYIAFFDILIIIKIFKNYDCDTKNSIIGKIYDKSFTRLFNLKQHYQNIYTFYKKKKIFTTLFIIFDFITQQRTMYYYIFITQILELFFNFFERSAFYKNLSFAFFETCKIT